MTYLLTPEGISVTLGRHYSLVEQGPHKGTWWRLDELFHDGTQHMVRCSRKHRAGRVRRVFAPAVFGLTVHEELTRFKHAFNLVIHARRKVDDGIILGALALIPLALFEAFHGGEATRHLIEAIFNSRANSGGGH